MEQPDQLSPTVRAICDDPDNELILSVVSLWEIQIKRQLGKLKLEVALSDLVRELQEHEHCSLLTVNPSHVLVLDALPAYHKDPFDRLLIAQARSERLTLLSTDKAVHAYSAFATILW